MLTRREFLASTAALAASTPFAVSLGPAFADEWPARTVSIVCPFAAGGNTDGIARMAAQRLSEALGKQFIVENRPGVGGAIAADFVAKSDADGYTLLIAALPVMAVVPAINPVRYDPIKDFAPISNIATNPFVLVVKNSLPAKTLKEFVDYVKAHPDKMTYSSAGVGSLNHLSMALFLKKAGIEMTHVPYKGNAPALADVIGGHIDGMFSNFSDALPQANGGNVRMLALSSDKRSPLAPNLPTVAESGYPGYHVLTWNGLMAPAKTPQAIIDKIASTLVSAVKDSEFAARLSKYGVDPLGSTPAEFAATLKHDVATWKEAVQIAGIKKQL
jgi:tripartite-type tricarboxylate transporter receptor subunit TctC